MSDTPIDNEIPADTDSLELESMSESQSSALHQENDTPSRGSPPSEALGDPPELQPYYVYPEPGQRPASRSQPGGDSPGCWVIGLLTGFVVASLVLAGLFLPPVSLGERLFGKSYTMFGDQGNAVPGEGFILSVRPDDIGTDYGISLHSLSTSDFLSADATNGEWIPTAKASIPPYLELRSGVHTIEDTGTAPAQVMLTIDLPADISNPYAIDLYAWDSPSSKWHFVPSRHLVDGAGKQMRFARIDYVPEHFALFEAISADPIILTALEIGQNITPEIAGVITVVSPTGMRPALPTTPQRTLVGNPSAGFDLNASYRIMPVVRNYLDPRATDVDTVIAIIGNRELRDEHIQQLTAFTSAGGYDGIFLDYRGLPTEQRTNFSGFIRELNESLHTFNLALGVVVPQASIALDATWETGAYDWRVLGDHADYLQINFTLNPPAYAPNDFVEEMLRWAISEVNRYKILGGLSALSVREVTGTFTPISYTEALASLGDVQLSAGEVTIKPGDIVSPGSAFAIELDGPDALPGVDTMIRAPFINYLAEDGTADATMWLTTGEALQFRLERFFPFGVGGVAFPDLLNSGVVSGLFEVLLNYRIQLPTTPVKTELALNWRIESVDGEIAEFTSNFNERIIVTVDAPDGNYAVNVDVVGGGLSSARSGAPVAVFAPTITPTPLPTNTPLPTPTPTPTLAPIVPTAIPPTSVPGDTSSPPLDSAPGAPTRVPFAPVLPPGGSIAVGSFEYGGHVTGTNSERAANAMNQAGMTWMKVQIRYGVGMGTGDVANAIGLAHMRGFKVLLGVVGAPSEMAASGGGYIQQFAGFVGEVAALGPDAIEVWNEPNLDREWPTGQISGANYTVLLRESYNAIKTRNPNVLVISAAPAPTGAEAAYPGQVVNDDNFLRQMVNAGALQYMDCLGMHYNEGIVAPTLVNGDPRDNYYTRYLPTMLDMYWNLTSGQRPVCITELGYLTPQGYGGLPSFFGWAANVTIDQQAAWLAGAAAYSSQSGRVRLMIVWNVDFTHYDSNDPMAGYAMIRANGDCPACRALAGAR